MQYVWTIIWAIGLVQMLNYILGSMNAVAHLDFGKALVVGVIAGVILSLLGSVNPIPKMENEHH